MKVKVDINDRIQEIRLIQALSEVYPVCISSEMILKLNLLIDKFNLNFVDDYDYDISKYIEINHALPCVKIGELERPLIYPKAITDYCKTIWQDRNINISFQGLLTEQRKEILNKIGLEIEIQESNKGRIFPIKAWDENYYQTLSKSKFVLCLNGDYIWSYRFFESILC